ncbi:Gfo/Idh/MocA family protein [Clostridium formicaceticum]|uniref:Oxidoreductase n=1 Tax=Clostridium formicaceticum TaxID=1497 RepID=A0AAC9WHC3_9CLOT|nr:Gfo/Idh/MocA family oxidoreductase [Clostridium formicaceticum]AOY78160.1 oxidoreductase [Clostridium formicaceticum]ARE88813.1 hypothetical protein CLFO_32190 [Clostridium formicaceticum]
MNCLVIGYGSIGQRHTKILKELGCRVAVLSQREIDFSPNYSSLSKALVQEKPAYIVVANETSKHYATLTEIATYDFKGIVLVEKPLFHIPQEIPRNNFQQGYVGYNLRFHPILQKLFKVIKEEAPLYAQIYVGQYLPNWRPKRDYRRSYSAKKNEGGGVLLDLSHELDYLRWFFDDWHSMVAMGGKYSSLQIDSEDLYNLMLVMKRCPIVQVHVNYLDRMHRREMMVITDNYTIKADLVQQTLQINEELIKYNLDRDTTYFMQHKAIISGGSPNLCRFTEGLKVLEMINAAETSAKERKWINK